ncbi:MAG: hypothetical protein J6A15_08955 [Clostridia bacterium]|nr:hypothetical protein [Clostridia bacterium]
MKKNNLIIIGILVVFVVVVIVTLNIALKNNKYVDNTLTMENINEIEARISEGALIKVKDFEEYKLDSTRQDGNYTVYLYNVNDKYRVEVVARKELVVSIKLINKVTERYTDIMINSLEQFLVND